MGSGHGRAFARSNCLAAWVAVAVVAAAGVGATGAAGTSRGLPDCSGRPVVRPAQITVFCADAGETVSRIRWSSWGGPTSVGHGTGAYDDCLPDCASGRSHTFRARLTALGTQRCPSGRVAYRSLRVEPVGSGPKRFTQTFPCRDAVAANLVATPALEAQLRAALVARFPASERPRIRGPLAGRTYYGRVGSTYYALAVFSFPQVGTTDQPEVFVRQRGRAWADRGDTGGCLRKIPSPLLRLWRLATTC